MTSIDEIVRELTGLLEKATPGPWWQESCDTPEAPSADACELSRLLCFFDDEGKPRFWDWMHDGALVVSARNHLPALLSALARSRRMEEALRDLERCARETGILYKYEALERSCVRVSQLLNDCAALEDNPNA